MFEIFYGKWMKYLYLVIVTVYSFIALWPNSTIAGSAWSSFIPFNFSTIQQCKDDDFQHSILPPEPCLNAYYICLGIFALIVIPLSLLDLKEQAIVQVTLGILRFVTIVLIILFCIINVAEFNNKCLVDGEFSVNKTPYLLTNSSHSPTIRLFDFYGWIASIPVFTFAIVLHSAVPSLTHPMRQKKYVHLMVSGMFITVGVCYVLLGTFVSLWFRADIQETCTLNWVS